MLVKWSDRLGTSMFGYNVIMGRTSWDQGISGAFLSSIYKYTTINTQVYSGN